MVASEVMPIAWPAAMRVSHSSTLCVSRVAAGPASGSERLLSPGDLGAWLAEHVGRIEPADVAARDLADALILREALARLYVAAADALAYGADDVDTINLFAATPDVPPALAGGRRQAGAGRIRIAQTLSTLAREAVGRLEEHGHGRVRRCAAEDCRLVFVDESRTGSRRWCSMQRCGNRAKVRAHRARSAQGGGHF